MVLEFTATTKGWITRRTKHTTLALHHHALLAIEPKSGKTLRTLRLAELTHADQLHDTTLSLRTPPPCGCDWLPWPSFTLTLPTARDTAHLLHLLRLGMTRHLHADAASDVTELSATILDAQPVEIPGPSSRDDDLPRTPPRTPTPPGPSAAVASATSARRELLPPPPAEALSQPSLLCFDVRITIAKARGLPPPPPLVSGPRIVATWGTHVVGGSEAGDDSVRMLGSLDDDASSSVEDEALQRPVRFSTSAAVGEDSRSPRWDESVSFEYAATEEALQHRSLVLELRHGSVEGWVPPLVLRGAQPVGRCEVSLAAIASGPIKYDLPLHSSRGSTPCGRVVFSVRMVERCRLTVTVPRALVSLRSLQRHTSQASHEASHRVSTFSLDTSLTLEADECTPVRSDFDTSTLSTGEGSLIELALPMEAPSRGIVAVTSAAAFTKESLHFVVHHMMSSSGATIDGVDGSTMVGASATRRRGEMWLPLSKVYAPGTSRLSEHPFDEVLWKNGQRVGRLSGFVRVQDGPCFVQMTGGFFTEEGIIPLGPIAFRVAGEIAAAEGAGADAASDAAEQDASFKRQDSKFVAEFEGPPPGLELPKPILALLALMQGLKESTLELHLDQKPGSRRSSVLSSARLSAQLGRTRPTEKSTVHEGVTAIDGLSANNSSNSFKATNGGTHGSNGAKGYGSDSGSDAGSSSSFDSDSAWGAVRIGEEGSPRLAPLSSSPSDESSRALEPLPPTNELASRRLHLLHSRLQALLHMTSKESTPAFLYDSPEALNWTQRLMLRLWMYILMQVDHMPYRLQPAFLTTLLLVMQRGELAPSSCSVVPEKVMKLYATTLWQTVAFVVGKLNRKGAPAEMREFCARALSVAFFRLPPLRSTLMPLILSPGENRYKHVREWNLPWSLNRLALRQCPAAMSSTTGGPTARGPTAGYMRRNSSNSTVGLSRSTSSLRGGEVAGDVADAWVSLWALHPCGDAVARAAMPIALVGKFWRERLRKRGHCFFLFLEQYARHAATGIGAQPDETVEWPSVPGYALLIKALLLEMSQRKVYLWPESMRSCMMSLVDVNRQLTKVFARVLAGRISGEALSIRETLAALQLLDQLMRLSSEQAVETPGSNSLGVSANELASSSVVHQSYELVVHHLKYLIVSERFKLTACALIFLYNHLDRMGDQLRVEVLSWLHREQFGPLALHWSKVVRSTFLHVAVLKGELSDLSPADDLAKPMRRVLSDVSFADSSGDGRLQRHGTLEPATRPSKGVIRSSRSAQSLRTVSGGASEGSHLRHWEVDQMRGRMARASPSPSMASISDATLTRWAAREVELGLLRDAYVESFAELVAFATSPVSSSRSWAALMKLMPRATDPARAPLLQEATPLSLVAAAATPLPAHPSTLQAYAQLALSEREQLMTRWEEIRETESRYEKMTAGTSGSPQKSRPRTPTAGSKPMSSQYAFLSMAGLCDVNSVDDVDAGVSEDW